MTTSDRLAVLIDADNAQASLIDEILAEVSRYGTASVKRAYGDWTTSNLKSWKEVLHKVAIQPMQQFAYTSGKNATDSALIIDAMDLLHAGHLDGMCLVSSDSDFTRLATRLRESGLVVYGFGVRTTPQPFVAACDKFIHTENLKPPPPADEPIPADKQPANEQAAASAAAPAGGQVSTDKQAPTGGEPAPAARRAPASKRTPSDGQAPADQQAPAALVQSAPVGGDLETMMRSAVTATARDDGWSMLSVVGGFLSKNNPAFDPRNYGYPKLGELARHQPYLETKDVTSSDGSPTGHLYVRLGARAKSPGSGKK